jgi:hypothetical protein
MRVYWDMAAVNYPKDRNDAIGFLRQLATTEPNVKELLQYAEQSNQEQSK